MTSIARSLLIIAAVTSAGAGAAYAQQTADDAKWIAQCVTDNKDEGQSAPVVLAYCTCMTNKMSSGETRSVSQWEKANPRTQEACSAEAGWKGK
ncbi:hypothetical protein [Aquabacter sp. CN5-332]|uniref:hypothetical protein n=1 Tax=Aquabacter sp. CN5-332 TaxID=3156608 RepID=UPI0032B44660